ncbi:MAG: hypothetical protein ACE5M4_11355, partial [Anaerolineales bacterium]
MAVEEGIPDETVRGMAQIGHEVEVVTGHMRAIFVRGQVILRDIDTGVLCGESDPRADGGAIPLAQGALPDPGVNLRLPCGRHGMIAVNHGEEAKEAEEEEEEE